MTLVYRSPVGHQRAFGSLLDKLRPVILPIGTALAGLLFWEIAARALGVREVILPMPSSVWETLVRGFSLIMRHAIPTAKEAFMALVLACVTGIATAIILSYSRLLRESILPNLIALQFVPKVAVAPLFIIWFGLGTESRLLFAVFIAFFPVMIATATGLSNTPPEYIRLGKALNATDVQLFREFRLPAAISFIFAGMKIAATMTMIGVVVGEFITAKEGLGYLILFASSRAETSLIFACLIILCVIGLTMYGAVLILEKMITQRFGIEV